MKSLLYILFLSFSVASAQMLPEFGTWTRKNPLPAGVRLNGMSFMDSLHGRFVGSQGTLVETADAGATWTETMLQPIGELQKIVFTGMSHGVIVGGDFGAMNGALFVTTDGGNTWLDRHPNPAMRYAYFDVQFIGDDTGWIAGFEGIFRTTDGGMTWAKSASDSLGWNTSVFFIDGNLGWCTNPGGRVCRSTDGGVTWHPVANLGWKWFERIRFATPTVGWAVGGGLYETRAYIFRTTDGGFTWKCQDSAAGLTYHDVEVIDTARAWVVGDRGAVLYTTDGGNMWFWSGTNLADDFSDIARVGARYWIAGGSFTHSTVVRSVPVGIPFPWEVKSSQITLSQLNAMAFDEDSTGWLAGLGGTLLKTADLGQSWVPVRLFSTDLYSAAWAAPHTFCFGGELGTFIKTTDNGDSWTVSKVDAAPVRQIQFVTPDTGWLVAGLLYRTTDAGVTWNSTMIGGDKVQFVDSRTGWLLVPVITLSEDDASVLYYTTDGGANWTYRMIYEAVRDFAFLDPQTGWFVSYAGGVFRTTDGGASWLPTCTLSEPVKQILFTSDQIGWVVGDYAIYRSEDGGLTFSRFRPLPPYEAVAMCFRSASLGFVFGQNGMLYEYEMHGDDVREIPVPGIPSELALEQNYPNPFNPTTVVSFQLPVVSKVTLVVYDVLGREVTTLIDETKPAGGYSVQWDASRFASGMYLVRLTAGRFTATRKILLLR